MSEDKTEEQQERQALRRQLREAGWNVGSQQKIQGRMKLELWPVPHTGPAEGVEPWSVTGANKTDALRTAVHELGEPSRREEP